MHGTSEDKSPRIQLQSPREALSLGRSQAEISVKHFPHAWTSFPFLLNWFNSLYTPYSLDRWTKRQTHASFGLHISLMKESFQPGSITDSWRIIHISSVYFIPAYRTLHKHSWSPNIPLKQKTKTATLTIQWALQLHPLYSQVPHLQIWPNTDGKY